MQELFTLVPRLFGTTSHCLSVHPILFLPSRTSEDTSLWLGLTPIDTGIPDSLLMLWNCFLDLAVEYWFGCRATEPGFAGDIGTNHRTLIAWLINWLIDWLKLFKCFSVCCAVTMSDLSGQTKPCEVHHLSKLIDGKHVSLISTLFCCIGLRQPRHRHKVKYGTVTEVI